MQSSSGSAAPTQRCVSVKRIAVIAATLLLGAGPACAGEKDDAVKLVADAAAAAAKDKAATLGEIGNPNGRYVKGGVYVFAYDLSGVMVAHPFNAKLVGKNLLDVPDVDGKLFRKTIIQEVKAHSSSTVEYKYRNPSDNKVEAKLTFCKKAEDLAICAGYYK